MARPLRIEFPGALYHVTGRGDARMAVAEEDTDHPGFGDLLASVIKRYEGRCYAYGRMDNHDHLLIEKPEANLSRGLRQLVGVYTQRFNRRHGRVGHLFQGRFNAILVDRQVRASLRRGFRSTGSWRSSAAAAPRHRRDTANSCARG